MIPISNITFEKLIAATTLSTDYTDKQGFFFRATTGGNIKYDPVANDDGDYITKAVEGNALFTDPVRAKKIYATGTTAQGIYIGKGV
jgi:hypothetical protein